MKKDGEKKKTTTQLRQEIELFQKSIKRQQQALYATVALFFLCIALVHLLIVYIDQLKASAKHLVQHFLPKIVHQEL